MVEVTAPIPLPVVLQGRYRIGSVIGRGGASTVYRAADLLLGRDVAVKVFTTRAISADDLRVQEGEARIIGRMHHPGLVGARHISTERSECRPTRSSAPQG